MARRALPVVAVVVAGVAGMPAANADNKRLNDGVVANVYTIQHQAGCTTEIKINPKLRLAAQDIQNQGKPHGLTQGPVRGGYNGKSYDSQEVVKQTRDVDHSRTIETQSVVPSRRLIETNHLIIRENETRNVGVVQHNHTIIEKELVLTKRNVDTKNVNTVVNLVEHKYNTERKRVVEEREIPGEHRDITCNCVNKGGYGPLQVYGQAQPADAYAKAKFPTLEEQKAAR